MSISARFKILFSAILFITALPSIAEVVEQPIPVVAEREQFAIYGGFGKSNDTDETDSTPWSAGIYGGLGEKKILVGLDLAGEGTSYDYTSRRNGAAEQGFSFNLLLGRNLVSSGGLKVDGALLAGARQGTEQCAGGQSYLGFQCYADADPSVSYKVNYGLLVTTSFRAGMVGVRATGESSQVVIGLRF